MTTNFEKQVEDPKKFVAQFEQRLLETTLRFSSVKVTRIQDSILLDGPDSDVRAFLKEMNIKWVHKLKGEASV